MYPLDEGAKKAFIIVTYQIQAMIRRLGICKDKRLISKEKANWSRKTRPEA